MAYLVDLISSQVFYSFQLWKQYKKNKEKASRVLEEFANVRTILPKFSSFLRLRIHSIKITQLFHLYDCLFHLYDFPPVNHPG